MKKATILLVEDEVIIAMEIKNRLQNLGYEVTSVVDTGEDAIKKAESDKPDLIIMDIRIHGEMDGIEAADIIRSRFGIPVIFSTACLDRERIERAKITIPFGYLLKPIQERDLKVTLEMALYVAKMDVERKESEERLLTIYNSTSNYMCLLEVEQPDCFRFVSLNDAYSVGIKLVKSDISRDEIIGLRIEEFGKLVNWPDSIIEFAVQSYKTAIQTKAPVKVIDKIPATKGILVLESTYTPIFDNEGFCTHILFVSNDITELKQAEKELRENEEHFKLVLKNSSVIVSQVDLDLRYTWVYNPHPDFDSETVIGNRDDELAQNEGINLLMQLKQQVIDTGVGSRKNIEIPLSDRLHIYDVKVEPLKDKQGKIIGATTASTDITDLHKE
jgi:two-component system, response regulator PdtaR